MTDYIPGPWVAEADGPKRYAIKHYRKDGCVFLIATVFGTHVIEHPDEKLSEHAQLIASAPRLKEERDELLDVVNSLVSAGTGLSLHINRANLTAKETISTLELVGSLAEARELIERIDRD